MKQFAYWYAYFDPLFQKQHPVQPRALTHMLNKSPGPATPGSALPELVACFAELRQFILEQQNWQESTCAVEELNRIENDVSDVLLLLELEKHYIVHFWASKRRIEASLAHLYAILQIFVRSLIPHDSMTVFECKAANKLCVSISNLQSLFKSLMKKINPICAFFSAPYFSQENELLRNFFENFVAFMKSIPKIKKSRMYHCSDLLKYILITNTLELTNLQFDFPTNTLRQGKSLNSLSSGHRQKKTRSCEKDSLSASTNSTQHSSSRPILGMRSPSCPQIDHPTQQQQTRVKRLLMSMRFVFPTWIRKHAIKHRKQSIPRIQISHINKPKSNTQGLLLESASESPRKMRNKSLTKYKLQHTPSVSGSLSPTKFHPSRSLPIEKVYSYQKLLEEDEQNCFLVQKQILRVERRQKEVLSLLEENQSVVNLNRVEVVDQLPSTAIRGVMKQYILVADLGDIVNY